MIIHKYPLSPSSTELNVHMTCLKHVYELKHFVKQNWATHLMHEPKNKKQYKNWTHGWTQHNDPWVTVPHVFHLSFEVCKTAVKNSLKKNEFNSTWPVML